VHSTLLYLTRQKARPTTFRGTRFRPLQHPKALREAGEEGFGVATLDRRGMDVRVTSLERTLVDVLDKPRLSGGWEEVWRSLEAVRFFEVRQVVEYALLLNNATLAAKVGFYLDQHRDSLMLTEAHLDPLRARRPRRPHYLDRGRREPGRLIPDWNLVVPPALLDRTWDETP